ncbi:hypothetical protein AZZ82_000154 [Klebsiella aerogenes]|nr:hypothetical protein AZZ82_000154 [Klebsiella aerogenes]
MHTHAKCVLGIASQLSWMGELGPEFTVRIPEGKRNANNAYFSVVHNILSIASVDYCLHIYNNIKTLFCQ